MKTVITFGTFDIFHKGHESYLRQAKKLGEKLIVVVARDKTVLEVKNQQAKNSEQERLKAIKDSGMADEVVLGDVEDRYAVIKKYQPDIIALGYDQKVNLPELRKRIQEFRLKTEIVRLESFKPEVYKSSKLKV